MSIRNRKSVRPVYYSIREAAWLLNVRPAFVSRAIRVGTLPTVPRRGVPMIPARALSPLLGASADQRPTSGGGA